MAAVFVLMLRQEETRLQLLGTGVLTLVLAAAGFTLQKVRASRAATTGAGAASGESESAGVSTAD
jgi:GABA permease